jgi:iron complex outermembrane recepter protein
MSHQTGLRSSSLPAVRPLAIGVALALSTFALRAQDAKPEGTKAEVGKLDTVTVTAERRTENIKDVPSAVTQLSGEKLDVINSGGQDLRMLSGRVPSLNIESSFGRAFPRFYIRGYGNTDFRLNASQPVSLVYDDVVQENPILKGFPVFDISRIEVLAGPQGTLFGRNTPAGVVKFDSVKPSKSKDAYANVSYGSLGTASLEGASNLTLSEDWTARASLQLQHRDNWVKNDKSASTDLEGYDDFAVRLQAAYEPSKNFSALFNLHARDLKGSARLFRANIIEKGSNELVSGFDKTRISIDGLNSQTVTNTGASMRLKWALIGATLYSITGYERVKSLSRGDVDGGFGAAFAPPFGPGFIPFPAETADGLRGHSQITQELRLESAGAGPLAWQAGVYLFRERFGIDSFSYNSLAGNVQTGYIQTVQSNDAWAVFGSVNYAVSPALKLRAGLRYTQDKKTLTTQPDASLVATNGLSANTSDSKVSWDASATYAVDKNVNLYARVATGFRASSIQAASPFGAQSQASPETITSYEVGAKADLFDKRARSSLSLFKYDVKDQQLTAVGGGSNATRLLNAKKAVGQGLEFSVDAYLTDTLLVTASGSYNLTKIKDPGLLVGTCGSCTVLNPVNAGGLAFIDGNALPNAPKWIGNVTARYSVPSASGGEYFVYTDWAYRSSVNLFLYQSVEFTGKPLLEGGLRLGYVWGAGKYEAALFGRNITNQIRVTGGIDFNNLTGFINEPRMVGAQFKAIF